MNFLQSVNSFGRPLTLFEVIASLALAFFLGLLVSGVYRLTNRNRPLNPSLMLTFIILSMIIALVMMVIGNSIARAFSLVGALSIIRFRTVVKDNRDIAYVFFALAAGMASGVGNYILAATGVGFIALMLLLLDFVQFGVTSRGQFLLRYQMIVSEIDLKDIDRILEKYFSSYRRLSMKTLRMGQFVEYTYLVRFRRQVDEQLFVSELSAVEGMERVTLIAEDEQPQE